MPRRTHCRKGHALTESNRDTHGSCRECGRIRSAARRAKLRASVPGDPVERRREAGRANFAKARAIRAEKRAARKRLAFVAPAIEPSVDEDIARYRAEKARRELLSRGAA